MMLYSDFTLSFNHKTGSKLKKSSIFARAGSSLGSARNLAREPGVFKSSARLGSIFGKLEEARCNNFLARRLDS